MYAGLLSTINACRVLSTGTGTSVSVSVSVHDTIVYSTMQDSVTYIHHTCMQVYTNTMTMSTV